MPQKILNPAVILPYLTICGAIYHLSFWNEFGLNGLHFISLSDILKSAAQPISYPIFMFLLSGVLHYIFLLAVAHWLKVPKEAFQRKYAAHTAKRFWILTAVFLILGVLVLFTMSSSSRWTLSSTLFSGPLILLFFVNGFLRRSISDPYLRMLVVILIVLLPFLSFSSGKIDASVILTNTRYQYVVTNSKNINNNISQDTLKLVGFTTESVILSNINNEELFILDRKIDTLILKSKEVDVENPLKYFLLGR